VTQGVNAQVAVPAGRRIGRPRVRPSARLFPLCWPRAAQFSNHWHYRHLLLNLVVRDLRVRYRGSVLGFAWTFLNPFFMTLIFSVVFTTFLHAPDLGIPFPIFLLVGMLAWNFCATSVAGSLASVVGNASIVTKVYFPRAILPLSAVLAAGVNFVFALLVLLPVIYAFGVHVTWVTLMFPLILFAQLTLLLGLGLLLAGSNVFYRDTAPVTDVLMQAWFFMTPVIYDFAQPIPVASGIDVGAILLAINPMAAVVLLYRQVLLYGTMPDPLLLARTIVEGVVALCIGLYVFHTWAERIADEL